MNKLKLTGKQIRAIGYPEGPVVSIAMHSMCTNYKYHSEEDALAILKDVLASPGKYLEDVNLQKIAKELESLAALPSEGLGETIPLNEKGVHYTVE